MAVDLSSNSAEFLDAITLGERQIERINSAFDHVSGFLTSSYELGSGEVFLQGSYANWTSVKPVEGGEYDVDVVAHCVDTSVSADAALEDLEERFRADGRFAERVEAKKPCVRLNYAEDEVGAFHVDVVPVRASAGVAAPLEAPRRGQGWKGTAPQGYTDWCHDRGELFSRTVKMLKRWRSEQQPVRAAIKSIVLQVLIADCMPAVDDDAERIADTFHALDARLSGRGSPPEVSNPVLPGENLAGGWTQENFASFVKEVKEASNVAAEALAAGTGVAAADRWAEVFGEDFPTQSASEAGVMLGDYSHAETPEARGWRVQLDPAYTVAVSARVRRGRDRKRMQRYRGRLLPPGQYLMFRAKVRGPDVPAIYWQVANTGDHAADVDGLRGEIFSGHNPDKTATADPAENWESTAYTGSHLIRAMLVTDDMVVAVSDWFQVNIAG